MHTFVLPSIHFSQKKKKKRTKEIHQFHFWNGAVCGENHEWIQKAFTLSVNFVNTVQSHIPSLIDVNAVEIIRADCNWILTQFASRQSSLFVCISEMKMKANYSNPLQ